MLAYKFLGRDGEVTVQEAQVPASTNGRTVRGLQQQEPPGQDQRQREEARGGLYCPGRGEQQEAEERAVSS